MKRLLCVLAITTGSMVQADCEIQFHNDGNVKVQITNPHKKEESFVVAQGGKQDIFPMTTKWWKHFTHKEINISVENAQQPGSFDLAYMVRVHHCREGWKGTLSMSEVKKMAGKRGNDEFSVSIIGEKPVTRGIRKKNK